MARRKIPMLEIREVIFQWQKGKGDRWICRSLGTSRNTIRRLLAKAKNLGLERSSEQEDIERVIAQLEEVKNSQKAQGPTQVYLSQFHEQIAAWRQSPYMTTNQMVRLFK